MSKTVKRLSLGVLALAVGLLMASCSQQAATNTNEEEAPKPIQITINGITSGDVIGGIDTFSASINEDSQVQEIEAYVDDVLVGKYEITASNQGNASTQALWYEFTLNSKACTEEYVGRQDGTGCSASDNTPVFPNGEHTVKVVAKNALETKEVSTKVTFNNRDFVAATMEGNSATGEYGYTWYGGSDLTLKLVPVVFSGKEIDSVSVHNYHSNIYGTRVLSGNAYSLDLTSGNTTNSSVTAPVNGGVAEVVISKQDNDGVSGGYRFIAQILYGDGTTSGSTYMYYAIDFAAPTFSGYWAVLNGVQGGNLGQVVYYGGQFLNGNTPLSALVNDRVYDYGAYGVGGVNYKLQVLDPNTEEVKVTLNPGDTLASLDEAPDGSYMLKAKDIVDALGNAVENPADSASLYGSTNGIFGLDKTAPVLDLSDFKAVGKFLNGTLGLDSAIPGELTEDLSGVGASYSGTAPVEGSWGVSGYDIEVTYDGCTYKVNAGGANSTLPTGTGDFVFDMAGSTADVVGDCETPNYAPTASSGDGAYQITIRVIDNARNISDPVTVGFNWLTQKPTLTYLAALPSTVTLNGASYFDADGSIKVNSAAPILKAALYAVPNGATYTDATDVQVVAPAPEADIANSAALTFDADGTLTGDYKDFTSLATSGFSFTARFNSSGATGAWDIVGTAAPEAYNSAGDIDVTNLTSDISQTVTVNP